MSQQITSSTASTFPTQVLNRQEAQSRLKTLTPGTQEYCQLENALHKTGGIVAICLPTTSYKVNPSDSCQLLGGFGSSEHVAIGAQVKLKGLPEQEPLIVRNSVQVKFEYIIALAGDYYGVVGQAIALLGGSDEEKTERFKNAYQTLSQADNNELRKVIAEIEQECRAVSQSALPHHCYSAHMMEHHNTIKKVKSDINALLIDNSDHFFEHAKEAYRIGHTYAMQMAKEAGQKQDLKGLKQAYALDAFACHFLTDLFAAGHVRNQRGELELFLINKLGVSAAKAKPLAGILTAAQHEKDGNDGLNVSNDKGDQWRAFGDGCFFTPKNKENQQRAVAVTQHSVDEIYEAYQSPNNSIQSTVDSLIPRATSLNPSPLYSVEGDSLFIYQGVDRVEIHTVLEYLSKGVSTALRYLPQEYINGFITPFQIEMPPILDKVIIPQVERFTGSIWHIVGLASHHHVTKEFKQINAKIDEMADVLVATYENTVKILKKLEEIGIQLNQVSWDILFQEIGDPIGVVKDALHGWKLHAETRDQTQLQRAEKGLWKAYIRLSRIFHEGTADNKMVLALYKKMLADTTSASSSERKTAVTLWFRQMLEYQIQAFGLYVTSQFMSGVDEDKVRKLISEFEKGLRSQIEINRPFIDEELVYQSQGYIQLQLTKSKSIQQAFLSLESKQ